MTKAHQFNLGTALGGSITIDHIPLLKKLQPDIVGIRGAVCEHGDRLRGTIKAELITAFSEKLKEEEPTL